MAKVWCIMVKDKVSIQISTWERHDLHGEIQFQLSLIVGSSQAVVITAALTTLPTIALRNPRSTISSSFIARLGSPSCYNYYLGKVKRALVQLLSCEARKARRTYLKELFSVDVWIHAKVNWPGGTQAPVLAVITNFDFSRVC